jgi:L-cysteine desulfidase
MGGTQEQIEGAISNMIASISGMVCDGAKLGCALKLVTASSSAVYFANMAMDGIIVPAYNGLVGKNVEESIKSMGKLAADGMVITDKVILKRMVEMDLQRC